MQKFRKVQGLASALPTIRQLGSGLPHLANLAADVRLAYALSWAFTELVRVSVTGGDRDICSMEHAAGKA